MTITAPPSSLFGLPLELDRREAEELIVSLTELWVRQMGQPPTALEADLDALHLYFDPTATERRLRTQLTGLSEKPSIDGFYLQPPLVIGEKSHQLVTLEGRVAIALLSNLLVSSTESCKNSITISTEMIAVSLQLVYERYRNWGQRRILHVMILQSGKGEAINVASLGLLILLLVNGSVSDRRGLPIKLQNKDLNDQLNAGLANAIKSFADELHDGGRDVRHFALYSGYVISEARRRIPEALPIDPSVTYIESGYESRVLELVARELRRPQRSFPIAQILHAFDRLVTSYRRELGFLAALGVSHEQRAETHRIRQSLETLLGNYQTHT